MLLINCEMNLIFTELEIRVISNLTNAKALAINHIKLYVSAVTLSTQDKRKFFQKLKSGF